MMAPRYYAGIIEALLIMDNERRPGISDNPSATSDVSRSSQVQRELRFLADASEQLTGSLDPQSIADRLARLSVPGFADWCTLDIVEGGGHDAKEDRSGDPGLMRRVIAKHVDASKEVHLRNLPPQMEERLGFAKVLQSGESQTWSSTPPEGEALDEPSAALANQLGMHSVMVMPLIARDRRLGVLSFGRSQPGRIYSEHDVVVAGELAHRAALALDNAYLYRQAEHARHVAEKGIDRAAWLFAVAASLSDAITPAAVLRVLVGEVVAAAGAASGIIVLRAGVGGELEAVRSTGYLESQIATFKRFDLQANVPMALSVRDKQPVFLSSDEEIKKFDPRFTSRCANAGEHAFAAIPLFLEGRVLGAVGFGFVTPQGFSDDDRAFMLALVQQGAQALERARLSALQTEEAVHLSHEVLKQMPEAILVTDLEGSIRHWLGEAESIFGYLSEEIVGKHMTVLHKEETREAISVQILQQTGASHTFVGEVTCVRRDGTEVPIEITSYAVHDTEGRPLFLVGIHRDITERKRAEEERARLIRVQAAKAEAEENARRFSFLAEVSAAVTASLDFNATLQTLARLAVRLADFCTIDVEDGLRTRRVAVAHSVASKEPLLRRFHLNSLEGDPGPVLRVLRSGRSELFAEVNVEQLIQSATSPEEATAYRELCPVSYLVVPLQARGRIHGTLSLAFAESARSFGAMDVAFAEEIAYRAALALDNARLYHEVQDANRLKDVFLGTVSDELRTPLNAILGWARMVRAGSLDRSAADRAITAIERNAEHQLTLIDELLDASRTVTGAMKIDRIAVELTLPVQAAVDAILPSAAGKGVAIEVSFDPVGVFVEGDPVRLQQVIWHLLSNAVKFSSPGSIVNVDLTQDERSAEINVRDSGEGISSELLPYVFDRFRQGEGPTTRRGLGLGLSIVKHIVELHGGQVGVSSLGRGLGTTFTVRLPISTGAAATALGTAGITPSPRDPFPRLGGLRILVVDDDTDTLAMLSAVLHRCGAEVTTATTATEALSLLETSDPALLIADIGMPGEDGYTLIRKVRDLLPRKIGRIPALALTPYARTEDRVRALAAGYQMYVPKPIEPVELAAAVKNLAQSLIAWQS